eukprot:12419590-Alexandrium_andersonii.AAC.1
MAVDDGSADDLDEERVPPIDPTSVTAEATADPWAKAALAKDGSSLTEVQKARLLQAQKVGAGTTKSRQKLKPSGLFAANVRSAMGVPEVAA